MKGCHIILGALKSPTRALTPRLSLLAVNQHAVLLCRIRRRDFGKCRSRAAGTAELGSCPTDATREGRSRRAIRVFAAMLAPECQREQSLRRSDPAEPYPPPSRVQQKYQTTPGCCQGRKMWLPKDVAERCGSASSDRLAMKRRRED